MKNKTLILIHPDHRQTLKGTKRINEEINLLIKKKVVQNFTLTVYNKTLMKKIYESFWQAFKKKPTLFLSNLLILNKKDLNNLYFLLLQAKNWGSFEIRYLPFLKCYYKYPAIIRYIYLFIHTKIWAEIIKEWATPYKSLITVCYYDRSMLPFVLSFRNQGKKVWDVQHGSITPFHFAYNKNLFKLKSNLLPTGFYVYQKNAASYLKKLAKNLFFFTRTNKNNSSRKKIILLTLQWSCTVPVFITEYLKRVKNKKIIIRMHPRDKEPISKKFKDPYFYKLASKYKNISIQKGSTSIESTLNSTYLHLTEHCSLVHDLAERGIPSFFWCSKFGPNMFCVEIKNGLATQIDHTLRNTTLTKLTK